MFVVNAHRTVSGRFLSFSNILIYKNSLSLEIDNAASASVIPNSGYQCRPDQNHILCQCCVQPMPDRQDVPGIHQSCK